MGWNGDDIVYDEDALGPLIREYGYRGRGADYDPDRPPQEWPFLVVVLLAGVMVMGLVLNWAKELGVWDPSPSEVRAIMAAWLPIGAIGTRLVIRREARAVMLALHESGFRYQGVPFRFDEIRAVRFGRPATFLESFIDAGNRAFGRFNSANASAADAIESWQAGSLRIELANGEERVLNAFRVVVRPEIASRFFELLEARRPGVVEWPSREIER